MMPLYLMCQFLLQIFAGIAVHSRDYSFRAQGSVANVDQANIVYVSYVRNCIRRQQYGEMMFRHR